MAGRLTEQSKEVIASVSEDERQKGRRIQVTDVLGRAASECHRSRDFDTLKSMHMF